MSGAEDSSSVSSASEAMAGVTEDNSTVGETLDPEFYEDVLGRLDDVEISANLDIPDEENDDDSRNDDTNVSIGAESSASDNSKDSKSEQGTPEAKPKKPEVPLSKSSTTPNKKSSTGSKDSKDIKSTGSVFSKLRRLTKADKKSRQKTEDSSPLSEIKIEKLPQIFVAKYLGKKPTKGLFGLQHVRKPVDRMIGALKKDLSENEKVELPLTYVVISSKGIEIREHGASRVKDVGNVGLVPIDFISYGVQDIKFWKVFTFIVVSELSSRAKTTECHAVLCDSDATARKMALSLAASFHVYKKKLNKEGKHNNFKVELRLPDQLAEAYEEECDA